MPSPSKIQPIVRRSRVDTPSAPAPAPIKPQQQPEAVKEDEEAAQTPAPSATPAEKPRAAAPASSAEPEAHTARRDAAQAPSGPVRTMLKPISGKGRPVAPLNDSAYSAAPPSRGVAASGLAPSAAPVAPKVAPVPARPAAAPSAPAAVAASGETDGPMVDGKTIHIKPPIIVRDLADAMKIKPFLLIQDLMEMNIFAAINHRIEPDVAGKICRKHGFTFEEHKREKGAGIHKEEKKVVVPAPSVTTVAVPVPKREAEQKEEMLPRAPIVTFMGHVDHGKTSLLDAIRKTKVAAGEAGGITQHIGAYRVEQNGQPITFLDTPGHAAFTAMRARGANVTDVVVLVVAADDGIMPQTREAIDHAKAAKVPIMVAINKIDLPGANIDRVKAQLQEVSLSPEDWGGETICCPVSAHTKAGIDQLLEMILLQAEVLELKSGSKANPRGRVVEAQMEEGRGPTATVIVQQGTLKMGQPFICGNWWGKVKQIISDTGKAVKEAGPSTPARVVGFSGMPDAGDELVVMSSEKEAKELSVLRLEALRTSKLVVPQRARLEDLFANNDNQKKQLQLIIKSDVQGSGEAIVTALKDIKTKKVELEILSMSVGAISEGDILLASASNAIIIGFNVKVEAKAVNRAKAEGVQVKLYSIIYELLDQIKEAMAGLLDPISRETAIGHARVKQVFDLTKGVVAGCEVTDGRILRTARARITRGNQPVYDGPLTTLKRFKDDVKEVRNGLECGIKLGNFEEYQEGDIIECYQLEKIAQTL